MSSGRAVRIPKVSPSKSDPVAAPTSATPADWRPNRAGTQRVIRLSALYAAILLALYGVLAALGATAPGGGGTGANGDLLVVSGLAALLGVGGVLFTLTQAPRGVEMGSDRTIVVGRWGWRRTFPAADRLTVKEVRQYAAGFLSSSPVVAVEITSEKGRRSSFLLEKGLLAPKVP